MKERRDLPKMGFVFKVNDYALPTLNFPSFSYMNAEELVADFTVVSELKPVFDLCEQICSNVAGAMCGRQPYIITAIDRHKNFIKQLCQCH